MQSGLRFFSQLSFSYDLVSIGRHLEPQPQYFRGSFAHEHPVQEDLKIVDHGTDILIQFDFQGDDFFVGIDMKLIGEGCIVYGIVFVKGLRYGIAYPVPAHIGLISQDDGGGDGIYRSSAGFVMLADGGDNLCNIFRGCTLFPQQLKGHKGSCMGMVHPIDAVSDIMHVAGDPGQFDGMVIILQLLQNITGGDGHLGRMFPGMVGVTQSAQYLVSLFQIDIDFFGMGYGFVSQFFHKRAGSRPAGFISL